MSHEIDFSNNQANIAYAGKTPWHGLGNQIDPDADLDQWRIAAGLNWYIQKRPLFHGIENEDGTREPKVIKDRFAHVRSDTQECIGIASNRFQLVQPGEILEFYRDLLTNSDFTMETAGSLNGGAKIWALAKYAQSIVLNGRDVLNPYLLLASANDGSMSTVGDLTTVRVVCNNTLTMAVGHNGGKASVRIPHSRSFNADAVKRELGIAGDRIETFAEDADKLANTPMSDEQMIEYYFNLFAKKDEKNNVTNEKSVKNVLNKLTYLYRAGPGSDLDTSHQTAWGALNALTNYVDFNQRARSTNNRFASSQFGQGKNLKAKAFDAALELAA